MATMMSECRVVAATSSDPQFPPNAIIDGDEKTFWISTGMFPQEFVVVLPQAVSISRIKTFTKQVRRMSVHVCSKTTPTKFEPIDAFTNAELDEHHGLQIEDRTVDKVVARSIKFVVHSGYDDFVAFNGVFVE